MLIAKMTNTELINKVEELMRSERKITRQILEHLIEIENRRLYLELGYESLYSYLTKAIGYSESAAYRRINSAKILNRIPEIAEKLDQGNLNLSQLTHLERTIQRLDPLEVPVSPEKTQNLLKKIEGRTLFDSKAIISKELNLPVLQPTLLCPQQDDSVRIELTFSKEQFALIRTAQNILSHVIPSGDIVLVLSYSVQNLLKKRKRSPVDNSSDLSKYKPDISAFTDHVEPAAFKNSTPPKQANSKNDSEIQTDQTAELEIFKSEISLESDSSTSQNPSPQRTPVPESLKRALLEKASYKCQHIYQSTGKKCLSSHQLEIDHIHPVAWGGDNSPSNLQVLCRTHNINRARIMGLAKNQKPLPRNPTEQVAPFA